MANGDMPANGGTSKDYLQRIEGKADTAIRLATESKAATLRLQRVLIGDPSLVAGDGGELGALKKQLNDFVQATEARENAWQAGRQVSRSWRLGLASLGVLATGSIGGLIVAIIHP